MQSFYHASEGFSFIESFWVFHSCACGKAHKNVLTSVGLLTSWITHVIKVLIAFRLGGPEHIVVIAGDKQLLFTPLPNEQTLPGSVSVIFVESEYIFDNFSTFDLRQCSLQLGLSLPQRKWLTCDINQELGVEPHKPHPTKSYISSMVRLNSCVFCIRASSPRGAY